MRVRVLQITELSEATLNNLLATVESLKGVSPGRDRRPRLLTRARTLPPPGHDADAGLALHIEARRAPRPAGAAGARAAGAPRGQVQAVRAVAAAAAGGRPEGRPWPSARLKPDDSDLTRPVGVCPPPLFTSLLECPFRLEACMIVLPVLPSTIPSGSVSHLHTRSLSLLLDISFGFSRSPRHMSALYVKRHLQIPKRQPCILHRHPPTNGGRRAGRIRRPAVIGRESHSEHFYRAATQPCVACGKPGSGFPGRGVPRWVS